MANNIELVEKMLPLIDEGYRIEAKSSVLDVPNVLTQATGDAKTIKVAKITTSGLGDYDRETGFPEGDIDLEWETHTFGNERGRRFSLDRMDNIESFGLIAATMTNRFTRDHVIPEVDAYRFAQYAKATGIGKASGALADGAAVIAAVRAAITAMDEAEVSAEDRVLFITPTLFGMVQDLDTTKSKEVFKRFASVVEVPQTRFYTDITMNSGADGWGYTKGAEAKDINFLAVAKSSVVQATKMALPKVFDPDTNQSKDAWKFQYRLYHDCFAYENKVKGIYVHTGA
jgi:hypothetical protein